MSGDFSRHSFDPRRDFANLFSQQGRVALDADWNEFASIVERRLRAETVDVVGRAVVPKETPDAFAIRIKTEGVAKSLTIGRGRIYVHGLLAENHGAEPFEFDMRKLDAQGRPVGVLAELVGTDTVDFTAQPYLPGASLPEGNGPFLAYLDVWQREITSIQDEGLLEKALGGVDTTTRSQTVWQVRLLAGLAVGATCASLDENEDWRELNVPSSGRLTTRLVEVADADNPCLVPEEGGYRGLENQLYRLEIHDGGKLGEATFKWSRDNASVATNVIDMVGADSLSVVRVGRDSVLRFNAGDWVEITDDRRALHGLPGELRKVKSVEDATRRITLFAPAAGPTVPVDLVRAGTGDDTYAQRHTRILRWDQQGQIRDRDGVLVVDLDADGSTGAIPVPAAGKSVILESGIEIAFDFEAGGGRVRSGDFWNFAARTADASIEELTKAPPLGIHHHLCKLAVVDLQSGGVEDCRTFWPPEFGGGEHCGCSVCVTPESHQSGTLTIQQAIDSVKEQGGTVCLDAGVYPLKDPIRVDEARFLRIVGQSWRSALTWSGAGAAVEISNSLGVTAENFAVYVGPRVSLLMDPAHVAASIGGGPALRLRNSADLTVRRCVVLQQPSEKNEGAAIDLTGVLLGIRIEENLLLAARGVATADEAEREDRKQALLTYDLNICDNELACRDTGIALDGFSLHGGRTRLGGNTILLCGAAGILCTGATIGGAGVQIAENLVSGTGDGIVFGTEATRVAANDITRSAESFGGDGIVLRKGLDRGGPRDCEVVGNRITSMKGSGIAIQESIRSAMIKQNVVRGTGGGIVMTDGSAADVLSIENNQLFDIGRQEGESSEYLEAVRAVRVDQLRIAGNSIRGAAPAKGGKAVRAAVSVLGCRTAVLNGNTMVDVGPPDFDGMIAAIWFASPFLAAQFSDNVVRRNTGEPGDSTLDWLALAITDRALPHGREIPGNTGFWSLAVDRRIFLVHHNRVEALPVADGSQIGVQGNQFFGWGSGLGLVWSSVEGSTCIFSNNQCQMVFNEIAGEIVFIEAGCAAVMGNIVRGLNREGKLDTGHLGIHIIAAPLDNNEKSCCTMLGNIVSGDIIVEPLDPIARQLNIIQMTA